MRVIEKVLSSTELCMDIPNYINGRSTQLNAQIVLTSLWVHIKGLMEMDEIHETMKCFETAIKQTAKEQLPLIERLINRSLIPMDRIIPRSLFVMWCKKCWQFLQCAKMQKYPVIPHVQVDAKAKKKEETLSPSGSQSSLNGDDLDKSKDNDRQPSKSHDRNGYDEFKDFRLQPFEYLLLVCNSFPRQAHMQSVFKPVFEMRKNEIVSNIKFKYLVGEDRLVQYELTD